MISDERLDEMADELSGVPGIRAVVLGGSRAKGTHHEGSDVDLGLYYDRDALELEALRALARRWDESGQVEVSGPGGWGPWVDGGGWLRVDGTPVDWILRDVARVDEQCRRALAGEFGFHPQPGHPFGFWDVSYAGELATCRPLADRTGLIADWHRQLAPYPPKLRRAMVENTWQADFLMTVAAKGVAKADIAYVQLCCSHAVLLCAHGWHAVAGSWVTNEKGAVPDVARLDLETADFASKASSALASFGPRPDELRSGVELVLQVVTEARELLGRATSDGVEELRA